MRKSALTLKDQVYECLFSDIIRGVYPQDMFLTEKSLMEKYQYSRAPIREALSQLTAKKFLISVPRHGYKIICPDKKLMMEIGNFRSILEPGFLTRYPEKIDAACIKSLREICSDYSAVPDDDYMGHWKYNCQFHMKIFSMYENPFAYEALDNALNIQTIYFIQSKHYATMDLHLAVIDYIEKKDICMAAKLLQADIENLVS